MLYTKNTFDSKENLWAEGQRRQHNAPCDRDPGKAGVACPSTADWLGRIWYFCTMESYLAIKKHNFVALVGKQMQLEILLMTEMVWTPVGEHRVVSLV